VPENVHQVARAPPPPPLPLYAAGLPRRKLTDVHAHPPHEALPTAAAAAAASAAAAAAAAMAPSPTQRSRPNILITGTPGTGKSSLAERVAAAAGFQGVDVSALAKEQGLCAEYDAELDTFVIDEDKVLDAMEAGREGINVGGGGVRRRGRSFCESTSDGPDVDRVLRRRGRGGVCGGVDGGCERLGGACTLRGKWGNALHYAPAAPVQPRLVTHQHDSPPLITTRHDDSFWHVPTPWVGGCSGDSTDGSRWAAAAAWWWTTTAATSSRSAGSISSWRGQVPCIGGVLGAYWVCTRGVLGV